MGFLRDGRGTDRKPRQGWKKKKKQGGRDGRIFGKGRRKKSIQKKKNNGEKKSDSKMQYNPTAKESANEQPSGGGINT